MTDDEIERVKNSMEIMWRLGYNWGSNRNYDTYDRDLEDARTIIDTIIDKLKTR